MNFEFLYQDFDYTALNLAERIEKIPSHVFLANIASAKIRLKMTKFEPFDHSITAYKVNLLNIFANILLIRVGLGLVK